MIFIDTGAFIARYVVRDQYHHEALPVWNRIQREKIRSFTSNFVIQETITVLARRAGYAFADRVARNLYDSNDLEILRSNRDMERFALELFRRYADQEVGYVDCVSFVLMHAHRLTKVFCFDRHFDVPGFSRIPLIPLS